MFHYKRNRSLLGGVFTTAELIFHAVVRNIRSQHSNAVIAILINIVQVVLLVTAFYILMTLIGRMTGMAKIRGEMVLFLLSGVFLFLTHIKSVAAIAGVGSGNNPMTLHSPMTMMVMLSASAFGILYTQLVSILVILFVYSVAVSPLVIQEPGGAFGMLLLAWFVGCSVGLVFLALKPWVSKYGKHPDKYVPSSEHDIFWQDVRRQRIGWVHADYVCVEPAVSHHRSMPWFCVPKTTFPATPVGNTRFGSG